MRIKKKKINTSVGTKTWNVSLLANLDNLVGRAREGARNLTVGRLVKREGETWNPFLPL